jgi:hypothetical protein
MFAIMGGDESGNGCAFIVDNDTVIVANVIIIASAIEHLKQFLLISFLLWINS